MTHLTALTLRSLPTELGGLDIARPYARLRVYGDRVTTHLRYSRAHGGVMDAHHSWCSQERSLGGGSGPLLGGHERRLHPAPPPHLIRTTLLACLILGVLSGVWRIIPLYGFTKPARSAAERRSGRINIRGAEANIKAASRKFNGVRGVNDALIQLLHSPSPVYSRVIDSPAREAGWQVPGVSLLDPPTSTWPSMSLCLRLHCVYRRNAAKNVHPSASKI